MTDGSKLWVSYLATWLMSISMLSQSAILAEDLSQKAVISPQAVLAAKAIQLPAGFTLKTVASEPNLANPVAFCFDPAGRIFVAETNRVGKGVEDDRHHPDWLDDDLAARTVAERRAFLKRHMGDRVSEYTQASEQVRLLEDRDNDGLYEFSSIFSTDYKNIEDGLAAGVLWHKDRVLFTCVPSLWELRDADGDAKAEQRQALATGFGVHTAFYGHDLHGLCEGPDGKIYFSVGDRGLNVETSDGVLFNPGSGAVLRCNPDGSRLEIFATGLRNPQELAFNEFGDLFTVDNNSDSGDKARLVHIVEGMDAGWRMAFQYLSDRGPFNREKIWQPQNREQPASIIPPLANVADGPSGLVHYSGTGLPAAYNGAFFLADFRGAPATSGIREIYVEPQGATYRLKDYKTFITGVLATDCDFGPSGDFFILDWMDSFKGADAGRVQRVTCDDPETVKQRTEMQSAMRQLGQTPVEELFGFLGHANMRVRMSAQQRLVELGAAAAGPLKACAASSDASLFARLHAIWALGELAERDPKMFDAIALRCGDNDAEVRAQAARTLGRAAHCDEQRRTACGSALTKALADSSPRVRCFTAIAIGKLQYQGALSELLQLATKDGEDPTLRHAAAMGLAGGQTAGQLVKSADKASALQRLVLAVALGKQKSPLVAHFLNDSDERVVLEAARVIWDAPVPAANEQLAVLIEKTPSKSDPLLRRVLAANVAGRTPHNLQALIDFASRADNSSGIRDLAWELVSKWATPSPRDSVDGDWRPLEPRPVADVVAALRASLPSIVKNISSNPTGVIVAAELGVAEANEPLLTVIMDDQQPEETRVRSLKAFGKSDEAIVHQAIEMGLKSPNAAVRSAARQLWADRFPAQVVERLSETADSGTMPERQAAIDALAGLKEPEAIKSIGAWMERVENGKCPPELQIEVLEAAGKSADEKLVERQKHFVEGLAAAGPISHFSNCLSGGDSQRGQKIFETNDTLACRRCHSVKLGEVLVGPNLASVGLQRKPPEILESVLTPNAKICEGFESTVLQLDTGKVVTGIVRRESDSQIELVDAEAKTVVVDPMTVESRVKGRSPMPENLMEHMSPRQLRDLVAYLSQLKAPVADGAASSAKSK